MAAASIENAADSSAAGRASLGAALLLVGRHDEAIASLEEAVVKDPSQASYQSDLAVAYLERARHTNRPSDYPRALAAAERALSLEPNHAAARFNRAWALDRLHIATVTDAWAEVPADGTSWAVEARERRSARVESDRRRKRAESELIERLRARDAPLPAAWSRQAVREWLEGEQLPAWGAALLKGDRAGADRTLLRATWVAAELEKAGGDTMPARAAEAIATAQRRDQFPVVRALARAHITFAEAQRLLKSVSFDDAARAAREAAEDFAVGQSPYALWAPAYGAVAERMAGRHRIALDLLDALERQSIPDGFGHLRGRNVWTRAVAHENLGLLSVSRQEFEAAVRLFSHSGEDGHESLMRTMLAETLLDLGDVTMAWEHEARALAWLETHTSDTPPDMVYLLGAFLSRAEGLPEAALAFHDAQIAEDERRQATSRLTEAYIQRANTLSSLGRWTQVQQDLTRASDGAGRLPLGGFKDRMAAEVSAVWAVHSSEAPRRAIAEASTSIDYFRNAGHPLRVVRLLVSRARAQRELGNWSAAEADLELAIEEFEAQRLRLQSAADRSLAFEDGRAVFEDMIRLQAVVHNQPDRAAAYAERSRAWAFPRRGSHRQHQTDAASVASGLPPGTTIAHYLVLEDRLLAWIIGRGAVVYREERIDRAHLEQMVRSFRSKVEQGLSNHAIAGHGTALANLLLRGLGEQPGESAHLIVVPDGVLHELPFAALARPSGRFLIEDFSVEIAPSLALAIRPRRAPQRSSVLAVGDGHVPSDTFPRLLNADSEAKAVAAAYPRSRVLAGSDATVRRFLDLAPKSDVIHFSGHGLANRDRPRYSRLLLAPDGPSDSGWLLAEDIGTRTLPRTDVVVLAACATAAGRRVSGEGPLNLVRPFLAAGARHVVASLWALDDHQSEAFFSRFHRELATGASSATALRAAQTAALRSTDPAVSRPAAWGGIVAFGGGVSTIGVGGAQAAQHGRRSR